MGTYGSKKKEIQVSCLAGTANNNDVLKTKKTLYSVKVFLGVG